MSPYLMDKLFDNSRKIGNNYDEEDTSIKHKYNKHVIHIIKRLKLLNLKEKKMLSCLLKSNMRLTQAANMMGIPITNAQKIRDRAFLKIRKKVKYNLR